MRIIYLHQYFVTRDMAGETRTFEMVREMGEYDRRWVEENTLGKQLFVNLIIYTIRC